MGARSSRRARVKRGSHLLPHPLQGRLGFAEGFRSRGLELVILLGLAASYRCRTRHPRPHEATALHSRQSDVDGGQADPFNPGRREHRDPRTGGPGSSRRGQSARSATVGSTKDEPGRYGLLERHITDDISAVLPDNLHPARRGRHGRPGPGWASTSRRARTASVDSTLHLPERPSRQALSLPAASYLLR